MGEFLKNACETPWHPTKRISFQFFKEGAGTAQGVEAVVLPVERNEVFGLGRDGAPITSPDDGASFSLEHDAGVN